MKTIYRILFFSAFIATFYSCKDMFESHPKIPKSLDCDFNDDKIIDFRIEYSKYVWDGVDSLGRMQGGEAISGGISSLNENSVLLKNNAEWLFRKANDTIYANVVEPYCFTSSLVYFISINKTRSSWEEEWSIVGDLSQDYYLVFKIKKDNVDLLGWAKLDINKVTGKTVIIDKRTTNSNFIIVGK